jgi:hypothetical protein
MTTPEPAAIARATSDSAPGRRTTDRTPADTWRACWVCLGLTLLSVCILAAVVGLVVLWGGE